MAETSPPPPPIDTSSNFHLPGWAIALIVTLVLLVVTAAIVVPLVLTLSSNNAPAPAPQPIVSPTVGIPYISPVPMEAAQIVTRLNVPYYDGLSRQQGELIDKGDSGIDIFLAGSNTTSLLVPLNVTNREMATPIPLDYSDWASYQEFQQSILLYNSNRTGATWRRCPSDRNLLCAAETWPTVDTSQVNPQFFLAGSWTLMPGQLTVASLVVTNGQYTAHVQSRTNTYPALSVALPIVAFGFIEDSVVAQVCSQGQDTLTMLVGDRFANAVLYVIWDSLEVAPKVQTLAVPTSAGRVLGADMTDDGQWLVVLAEAEIRLYVRNEKSYRLADVLFVNTDTHLTTQIAMERKSTSGRNWLAVLVTAYPTSVLWFKVLLVQQQFDRDHIRQTTARTLVDTKGRMASVLFHEKTQLVAGLVSDTDGHQEVLLVSSDF